MKCHYEVLGVDLNCTPDDLKKAYRKLALEWHPDKNLDRLAEATEIFQLIQQAYEVLIDPQERAWYDRHREDILRGDAEESFKNDSLNVYQYYNGSCFKGYNDDEKGFYTVYRQVFETIAAEDRIFMDEKDDVYIPSFGYSTSSYEEVVHDFYAYWQSYCTSKSFSWVDKYDLQDARKSGCGRQDIRLMEKENKKLRDLEKKARNEEIRELVAFVRKRDKRVQAHKKLQEEKKAEKAKRAEQLRKQQVIERNKALENYTESEWLAKSDFEEKYTELENALDADFGSGSDNDCEEESDSTPEDLYCVACEKDFRTEKAMKNHENSKKHKENVALLKFLMEEEESVHKMNEEKNPQNEDKTSESDLETSQALLEELVKNSSKSKKKKKKAKNISVDCESNSVKEEEDLSSKLDKIEIVDASDKDLNTPTPKSNVPKKKDRKNKSVKEKQVALPAEKSDEEDVEEKTVRPPICETCNVNFKSRNKLFDHLKESGHASYKNGNTKSTNSSKKHKKNK